ncbi:FtsX-like permease family protein [Nocardia pseudovaccinii]|uniref:FtsX-like permease family protein n=1 Tax=Nocardia pseudovaccinii TaxID=189540 RepID=UPI0007A3A727|nr:FtsX-like permease family protein [Nocardia pseudovaccinii]
MPNRVLVRKVGRDLRGRVAQVAAIAVTVLLGVLLFVASYDSFRNLETSYRQTYERLRLADFTARGGDPAAIAAAVRDADGVARVATRTQADVPMTIGATKLVGRITGSETAGIDEIDLTAGSLPDPAHSEQVVVEHHAAQTFDLTVGSRLRIFDGTDWRQVTVSGVARSAEYLWPARSRQDIIGDPHAFAVVFAPQAVASRLAGQPGPNQTLVVMSSTATTSERDRVVDLLRSAGAAAVEPQREQPSNAALHEDLDGFSEIAVGFPALFLIAAAIAEYVLITRLVQAERPIIGTLLAMGARRRTVIGHYVGYGVAITGVGALLGVLGGFVVTSAVTAAYTRQIGIPDTVVEHRIATAAVGFALGLLTGVIAALVPAIAAARIAPAAAMRGDGDRPVPAGRFARRTARWHRLPVVARMALRSLTRGRRRTIATMTGTVLALVLILASVGMLTSMRAMLNVQFGEIQQEDATVLVAPGTRDLLAQLRAVPGVAAVEPSTMTPVTVAADGESYSTTLTGLPSNTTMHGFRDPGGDSRQLPVDGVLAGAPLAAKLGVHVGDILTVTPAFGAPQQQRLAGFVDEPLGTALYATDTTVRAIGGLGADGYLLRFAPDADRNALRAKLTELPGVIAYTDTHALESQVDEFLGLLWIFIAVMLILGATLAFTVIYVTMTVNLAERTTELATLRAAGVPVRRLTAALAIENLTATLLAVPLGLAAGIATAWAFLRTFTSDMFDIDLVIGTIPPLLAVAAVVAAAALSQLPAGQLVQRIDVARVVRERAR